MIKKFYDKIYNVGLKEYAMATTVSTTIPADNSSLGYWEKTVTDVNNVDESFANARDLGYTRLNYARVSVVGKLSEYYDSSDMYKIQLQSNGTVSLSIKGGDSSNEKVLDLSAYEQKLDELKRITDPEGWAKEQEEKKLAEQNKDWMAELAPGLKVEVYTINKNGKETLIGDSSAEKGTETRDNIDAMFSGEYKAKKIPCFILKLPVTTRSAKMKSWLMFYKFSRVKNISMTMFRKKVCRMILKTRPKPKSR